MRVSGLSEGCTTEAAHSQVCSLALAFTALQAAFVQALIVHHVSVRWIQSEAVRMGMQSTQQGGTLVFKGTNCTWAYYDEATAAHATSDQIIDNALAA